MTSSLFGMLSLFGNKYVKFFAFILMFEVLLLSFEILPSALSVGAYCRPMDAISLLESYIRTQAGILVVSRSTR